MHYGERFSLKDHECLSRATGATTATVNVVAGPNTSANSWKCSASNLGPACGGESTLDVQVAMTVNQDAEGQFIAFYNYLDFIYYFDTLHKGNAPLPTVISTSYPYVWESNAEHKGLAVAICNEFYLLATAGVTTFAASGDGGASGSGQKETSNINTYNQQSVPSCPFVTSVGGTSTPRWGCSNCETAAMQQAPGVNISGEYNFTNFPMGQILSGCQPNEPLGCITSGGGYSRWFTEEAGYDLSFQRAATEPYTKKYYPEGLGRRAFPDISANSQNWMIFQRGGFKITGGTSAAAPTLAAIISQAYVGSRFGWLNPLIYEKYAEGGYFWDITAGNNYWGENGFVSTVGFNCSEGWDPVTGVGSFGNASAGGAQRFLDVLRYA